MRRLLLVLAACGFLTLSACDFLERDGDNKSEAEQAVAGVRDGMPSGMVRTLLDVVLLGLGIYGSAKGKKAESTEKRDYNVDEGRSMIGAVAADPMALEALRKALADKP